MALSVTALVSTPSAAAAELTTTDPLGRLFFTPERRAALERQRLLNIQESQTQLVEGANLTVSGVVQRSSGKRTTWINGTAQHDNSNATGVRIEVDQRNPGRTTISIGEEAPASLKVGESINRATRETSSSVGKAQIVIKRSNEAVDKAR